jgi:hypothetical protein
VKALDQLLPVPPNSDGLQPRMHHAESRVKKVSLESPATLMSFDLLASGRRAQVSQLGDARERRQREAQVRTGAAEHARGVIG